MIRVITDSTSSIPRSLREEHGIELFSLFVNHDGKEYKESSMDLGQHSHLKPACLVGDRTRLRGRGQSGGRRFGRVSEQQDVGHVRKRRTRRKGRRGEACVVSLRRYRQPHQLHGAGVAGCLCGKGGGIGHGPARMRPACVRARAEHPFHLRPRVASFP